MVFLILNHHKYIIAREKYFLNFPFHQEQRPVNIPIDFTNASIPPSPIIKSSTSSQYPNANSTPTRPSSSRTNSNENDLYYYESYDSQRPSSSSNRRLPSDTPSNQNQSSAERTVNEIRVNIKSPSPYQQQEKKTSLPINEDLSQQYVTK